MSTTAAHFVGSIPENYDQYLGPLIFLDYADDLARRVSNLRPGKVLELASGTGIVTRKLRDMLEPDCELVASDLNPPMLEVAKAKFHQSDSVQFEQVDATKIPFKAASFDAVACQFGVMFFPDKDESYAEVRRVLKPGGSYVFNVWDSWESNPFAHITHRTVEKYFPDDPPGFYKVPFGYHDAEVIKQSVLSAGFTEVNIATVSLTSKIPSAARFAHGLVYGNPLHEEIANRGGDPQEICRAVEEALEQQLGSEMSLQALVIQAS